MLQVIPVAVQGELQPLTAAVAGCLPSLPLPPLPEADDTGSGQGMPPSGRLWLRGEAAAEKKKIEKKKK